MLVIERRLSKFWKIIIYIVFIGCLYCCRSLYDERFYILRTLFKDVVVSMGCLWVSDVKYYYMKL